MLKSPATLPTTLPVYVKDEIRRRIVKGEYQPGKPFREQDLEAEFASSRGPIREGLRLLLINGLVEHTPRRGFRVVAHSEKDLVDLYHLRATLEASAVEALAAADEETLVEALRASQSKMRLFFRVNDVDGYFDENLIFHKTIFEAAQNKPLKTVLEYVDEVSLPMRYKLLSRDFKSARSLEYHERLIELIAARSFGDASLVARDHILENLEQLKSHYRTDLETASVRG